MQPKHCFIQFKLVRLCVFYQIHVDTTLVVLQTSRYTCWKNWLHWTINNIHTQRWRFSISKMSHAFGNHNEAHLPKITSKNTM